MDRIKILIAGLLLSVTLPGFPALAGEASVLGTVMGATVGAVLGNQVGRGSGQFVMTTLGMATGGMVGNAIGQGIDRSFDSRYRMAPISDFNGNRRSVTHYNTYRPNYVAPPTYIDRRTQYYCRPYSQEIIIDGYVRESYGTACLHPDGTWRIVP